MTHTTITLPAGYTLDRPTVIALADGECPHMVRVPCGCPCHTSSDPDIRADAYLCDECDELEPGYRTVEVTLEVVEVRSPGDVDNPDEPMCRVLPGMFALIATAVQP